MEVQIAARHMDLTPTLVDFIHKKINRVNKYFNDLNVVHVVLECEKYRQTAQFVFHISGSAFRAKETAGDMYAAIDLVSDKIDMQLKKFKEKRTFHHGKNKYARESLDVQPARSRIVGKGAVVARTMEVEEATELLSNGRKKYVIFNNSENQQLNMLVKKGKGYELIDILFE